MAITLFILMRTRNFTIGWSNIAIINAKIRGMVENTAPPVYEEIKANEVSVILKGLDRSVSIDYSSKFKIKDNSENILIVKPELVTPTLKDIKNDEETLIKALKTYRTTKASLNNVPAYCIFTNDEMGRIVDVIPKDKQQLISIKGFGEVKFEKYGEDIIDIINSIID